MTDVKNSRLYKTLKKAVRRQDHAELLRMLEMIPAEDAWLDLNDSRLISAFIWDRTPQGHDYWWVLREKLMAAGHDCY